MNLLVVSPKFHPVIGGGETFVLNSVKKLHDEGIRVSIATEPRSDRKVQSYPYPVHEIKGLSDTKLEIIDAVQGLRGLLRELKPDIIHVHGYFALLVVGLCNEDDIPVIVSIHSTPVWGQRIVGNMGNFDTELQFARRVLELAKPRIVTAANEVYSLAAKKIVGDRSEVVTFPYPVDDAHFFTKDDGGFRQKYGLNEDDVVLLVPSRIIERKGIREAVEALSELPQDYHLLLPGAVQPLDEEFWESITSSEAFGKVKKRIIIPQQSVMYEDMPKLYAACDVVVMPSYYEGAPVATVEAMTSGKPFVGADSQGINSFIQNDKNGLLVPVKNTFALTEAILRLQDNRALASRLAERARHDVRWLCWDDQLPGLLRMYDSVVKEPAMFAA